MQYQSLTYTRITKRTHTSTLVGHCRTMKRVDPTDLDRISTIDLIKIFPLSSSESLGPTSRAVSLMTAKGKGYAVVGGALHLHLYDSAVYSSALNPLSIPPDLTVCLALLFQVRRRMDFLMPVLLSRVNLVSD